MEPTPTQVKNQFYDVLKKRILETDINTIISKELLNVYNKIDGLQEQLHIDLNNKIACGNGCSFCCYFNVELRPQELFLII